MSQLTASNKLDLQIFSIKLNGLSPAEATQIRQMRQSQERIINRNRKYLKFLDLAQEIELQLFSGFIEATENLELLVDPYLANFPFEGLPIFQNSKVKRVLQTLRPRG